MRYFMHMTAVLSFSFFMILGCLSMPASAAYMPMVVGSSYVNIEVKSFVEKRFANVIQQQRDFSCGSAALATLLKFHYDKDTNEQEVLNAMFESGDKEKIRSQGFSLLDMKKYLESTGLDANGYRASLDKLVQVGVPAIALINSRGYLHFVVVKGVNEKMVLVGDPALGKRIMDRAEFESMWNGVLFVIDNDKEFARATFNKDGEWTLRDRPQMSVALSNQVLSNFTTFTSITPNYFN